MRDTFESMMREQFEMLSRTPQFSFNRGGVLGQIMDTDSGSQEKEPEETDSKSPLVTWDDVIGLEDAKSQLQEAIEAPFLHKEIYDTFNITPPKGVLLYGPPGCGKTLIGKACAHSIAKLHNKKVFDGFFYYNGAEMFGPHVGCEEKWLREAFAKADEFYKRHGYKAVLFFDEADSMLPHREKSPPWTRNAVNQFLSLMDGMKECSAFIILATNNHLMLDSAAIRAGRIDRKIYVGAPTKEGIKKIVDKSFSKKPTVDGITDFVLGELYSESRFVGEKQFSDFINGANAAAISDIAASFAFNRALKDKLTGKNLVVTLSDARKAIDVLFAEILEFSKAIQITGPELDITINHKIQSNGTSQDSDIY